MLRLEADQPGQQCKEFVELLGPSMFPYRGVDVVRADGETDLAARVPRPRPAPVTMMTLLMMNSFPGAAVDTHVWFGPLGWWLAGLGRGPTYDLGRLTLRIILCPLYFADSPDGRDGSGLPVSVSRPS